MNVDFSAVVKTGELMINEEGHYASDEIRAHLTRMLQCREALHTAWQLKKVYLVSISNYYVTQKPLIVIVLFSINFLYQLGSTERSALLFAR